MITESIFNGKYVKIPMSDVQHVELYAGAARGLVITDKTKWNYENDTWDNPINLGTKDQLDSFLNAWCRYRAEREGLDAPDPALLNSLFDGNVSQELSDALDIRPLDRIKEAT